MSTDTQKLSNATVIGREIIHPELMVMRVRPDDKLFEFKPGQFAVLGLPGNAPRVTEAEPENPAPPADTLIRRAYSIASASVERRYVEFYITLITSGQLTPRLFALQHGSKVFLGPKASGTFTLDRVPEGKTVLLVATGTGLAPYVSMLRTFLAHETKRKIVVLHGARYSWDLGYRGELETLSRLRPNFTYIPSITRPDQDQHFLGRIGRIQAVIAQGALEKDAGVNIDPKELDVFLCGNPEMIKIVTEMLEKKGFKKGDAKNPGNIHVEEYW
jgi:ferredoxin/flavodoxin---NADP+ reductase